MDYNTDLEIGKEFIHDHINGIDWDSFSPEIGKMLVSPSLYLMQAHRRYERKIRELLVDYGVTETQFDLLIRVMVLTKKGDVVTQMNLANFFNADKMVVSQSLAHPGKERSDHKGKTSGGQPGEIPRRNKKGA